MATVILRAKGSVGERVVKMGNRLQYNNEHGNRDGIVTRRQNGACVVPLFESCGMIEHNFGMFGIL